MMSDKDKEITELKAENDALRKRMEKLEEQVNPSPRPPSTHQRFDPTEGMSMPASAIREMVNAIPESVMRGIVADARKPNPVTGGPNPQPTTQVQRGSGWRDEVPISSPPGLALADRLVDQQDKIDRAERAYAIWKAGLKE